MESTIAKGYDKRVNPDGSFELSFKARRFGPQAAAGLMMTMVVVLYPVSCAVTLPVASMALSRSQRLSDVSLPLWNMLALALYFTLAYVMASTKTKILVKPNIGIVFAGEKLPFKEISQIGTIDHPMSDNKKGSAFVYATTHGTQVKLSKYVSSDLAEAVAKEIKAASGIGWNNI